LGCRADREVILLGEHAIDRVLKDSAILFCKWIFQRIALRSEPPRAIRGNIHVIFEAHAEFAPQVDAGFVGRCHVRLQGLGVALHQVGPFMTVHANSVTDAVREVRIARTEARVVNNFARGGIHCLAGNPWFGCIERGRLSFVDRIEDTLHLVSRFTHDERAADVRLITFHDTAIVNENNAAFADYLGLERTVGESGPRVYLATRVAGKAGLMVPGRDEVAELAVRHAGLE